ncbi:MAG: hypothetical protein IEMM0008_1545 [bacterium]|nr:MAG: hypothetical protein IEMM0008_1545 [bacterium]
MKTSYNGVRREKNLLSLKPFLILISIGLFTLLIYQFLLIEPVNTSQTSKKGPSWISQYIFKKKKVKPLKVKKIVIKHDQDGDGILDLDDMVQGARKDAKNKSIYKSAYYRGGYPPKKEGVCTDVIWRAFKNAGYNLKRMMDKDIRKHTKDYPRVNGRSDPNIDFRRVPNQLVYFKKYAKTLTKKVIPNNAKNLIQWQGGDIVTFDGHIAIVSDKRRPDGVPYLIHNEYLYTWEKDNFMDWKDYITGHFRYPNK